MVSSISEGGAAIQELDVSNAVVIVAHPDDEILWFSSILGACKRVVVCFGPSTPPDQQLDAGREALIDSYPLPKVRFLKLRQSDAYQSFNWRRPEISQSGLIFRQPNVIYSENSKTLLRLLDEEVAGENVVITHNPWGEYGHEEHVQVFDTLKSLRHAKNFEIWVSGYVSNRSQPLMSKRVDLLYDSNSGYNFSYRETDAELALKLKDLYKNFDCWTWMPDYEWPALELFYRLGETGGDPCLSTTASIPLSFVSYQFAISFAERLGSRFLPPSVKRMIKKSLRRTPGS